MKVDWNPLPIRVGVIADEEQKMGILMIVRTYPMQKLIPLKQGPEVPAGCIAVHLPMHAQPALLDLVTVFPSRSYMYDILASPIKTGEIKMQLKMDY